MKKVLALAAAGLFVLASCKKDYTCSCTATDSAFNKEFNYSKVKKKDAESTCSNQSAQYANIPGGKCSLK